MENIVRSTGRDRWNAGPGSEDPVRRCVDLPHEEEVDGGRDLPATLQRLSSGRWRGDEMSIEALERRFAAVGARVKVAGGLCRGEPRINIRSDARGEYFELWFAGRGQAVELEVVDVHPRDRHLLLLARIGLEKSKFLCGHDERHWFDVAAPETRPRGQ